MPANTCKLNIRRVASWAIAIGCAALLASCLPGAADYSYDVSGGYHLVRSSAHQIKVVPKAGWGERTPIIPAKVVEIAWDNNFILAKQQQLRRAYPDHPNNTYLEPTPGQYSYWILSIKEPVVFGPLDEAAFWAKRAEIGVPNSLQLRDVEAFKR